MKVALESLCSVLRSSTYANSYIEFSTFIQPYFIEELGCEGLSSEDIANCLQAQHQHVSRKIFKFSQRLQISVQQRTKVADAGRPQAIYLLPTNLAKIVVAKYENEIGNAYLGFLLECERVATELTPKLVERVKELESIVERQALELDTAKKVRPIKRIAPPKTMVVTDLITHQDGIFGEPVVERHFKRVEVQTLTKKQILQARVVNLTRQTEGAAKAAKIATDQSDLFGPIIHQSAGGPSQSHSSVL